jgi:predicted DNA-binding transcriptional regulator AlpA
MNMSDQQIADDDIVDLDFVCGFFGGTRSPLHPSTVYRAVNEGRISRPFKTTKNANRWLGREIKADRQRLIDAKREPLLSPYARKHAEINR